MKRAFSTADRGPARIFLAILPAALILIATPAFADDSVQTLALARPQSSITIRPAREARVSETRNEPVTLALTRNLQADKEIHLSRVEREPVNPLILAGGSRDNRRPGAGTLEAGFGEVFRDRPAAIYGRNGAGWEEPSCGYVKWSLKF